MLDFICDTCLESKKDVYIKSGRDASEKCTQGHAIRRAFSAPARIKVDFVPGFDIGLGKDFSTKKERDDELERKGLRKVRD